MSDRRPARVRIYSGNLSEAPQGTPAAAGDAVAGGAAEAADTPQRRRTDPGYRDRAPSGTMGMVLLGLLFVIGAAAGGALSVAFNLVEMPIR